MDQISIYKEPFWGVGDAQNTVFTILLIFWRLMTAYGSGNWDVHVMVKLYYFYFWGDFFITQAVGEEMSYHFENIHIMLELIRIIQYNVFFFPISIRPLLFFIKIFAVGFRLIISHVRLSWSVVGGASQQQVASKTK